ncbi:MAG: DUF2794 domain-containing protein [Ancylobacter novellus]|uniref:DUF2794 domain-containing protein n=1 Tax=Ancylobacter novellus TaxID=921 RepID=A0A2W5K769_ANCNO|nr:MAG: DUF2794 domain-containing protein [Ancylobacter novellus]
MSESEPIRLVPRAAARPPAPLPQAQFPSAAPQVSFDRRELNDLLTLYGRMVAAGEWRDYAIDFLRDQAVFSVFRRTSEAPLYRIEKTPRLARRQGAYAVVAAGGLILKRGPDLARVLSVIEKKTLRLVTA